MDTELKETLKLLQTIANRAYWEATRADMICGKEHLFADDYDCQYCHHRGLCTANKRLNELLGEN